VAVSPPFPLAEYTGRPGTHVAPLVELFASEIVIGILLLRLGRYAVGVLRGDELVASKTGTRHVKSRHRAGGSSQRRFERSRERLVRELFDKTCEVARAVLSPYEAEIEYVLTGGERHTLGRFVKRCRYMRDLDPRTLGRVLQITRPGQKALDGVAAEVWRSRVLVFEPDGKS
jgi:peptide subunit release factor 1 (eRF1)